MLEQIAPENFDVTGIILLMAISCVSWQILDKLIKRYGQRRPPGPVGIPFLGYLPFLGKEPHRVLWNMREKYGDIIGLYMGTKYTIVLNEYSVMKDVLSHSAALDRAPDLFSHLPRVGFASENGEKWVEQRRFCLSSARDLGFGKGHWEDLIMDEALEFVDKIGTAKGRPTDVSRDLASSINSNIVALLIGRRLNKAKEADKIQLSVDFSEISFTFMGPSNPTCLIPGLRTFCQTLKIAGYDKAKSIVHQFSKFIQEEISLHKTSPALQDLRNFVNAYLEKLSEVSKAGSVKHSFSESMLEGNMTILFLGASDTVLSSLGWLMRLMTKHRDIQDKVYRELMDVLGKDGRARYEERGKIPYTFAVIMEAQRFSSIVPLSTTRALNQDLHFNGYVLPKGSEVFANLWALHNDPAYWDKPEEFRPERFLEGGTRLVKQPPSYAPFSVGRRNCPGETIAWMEILSYFSEIVKNFEISTPPGDRPDFEVVNGLVSHLKPQQLCFKERK